MEKKELLTEAAVMDIVKNRWSKKYDNITYFHVQKETKAKIEDVIPYYFDGDMKKTALDFASYLQRNLSKKQ